MARIELENIGLTFRIRNNKRITLKEFVIGQFLRKNSNAIMEVKALQNITMNVGQGDRVGVIGHNGAGKSTLLRVLAGIYPPTAGNLIVEGRISSLFDISLGFESDANGWENIAYRSYLQGETPRTVRGQARRHRRVQRTGRLPQHAGALLFRGHGSATGVFDRHGHRSGNPAGRRSAERRRHGLSEQGAAAA